MNNKVISINEADDSKRELEIPSDLYIPPDALEVVIHTFEGPLDLLLYLIRKNKFDVLDIPVAEIARQYASYIDLMQKIQLELAGEYLAMAATLAHIKSRLLLPAQLEEDDDEQGVDPRAELALQLQEYEKIRNAAKLLEEYPRIGRDLFVAHAQGEKSVKRVIFETVDLVRLIEAFKDVLRTQEISSPIVIERPVLFVKDKIKYIVEKLKQVKRSSFVELFNREEGKAGIIVTFLALLELINSNQVYAVQSGQDSTIHIHIND